MALEQRDTGQLDKDGRTLYNYRQLGQGALEGVPIDDPSVTDEQRQDHTLFPPVVYAGGPYITGSVKLVDGRTINVSDHWIEVPDLATGWEVSHHIGLRFERDGHPLHTKRSDAEHNPAVDEYVHDCSTECGPARRTVEAAVADFTARTRGHVGTPEHDSRLALIRANHAQHGDTGKTKK